MDPLSITVSVSSLLVIAAQVIQATCELRSRYKDAAFMLAAISTECTVINNSLAMLQTRMLSDQDLLKSRMTPEIATTFEAALQGCELTMSVIQEEMGGLQKQTALGEVIPRRLKYVLAQPHLQDVLQQIRGQQTGIGLLLQTYQVESNSELTSVVRQNHDLLQKIAARGRSFFLESVHDGELTSKPKIVCGVDGELMFEMSSIVDDTYFDFDEEIINTARYRRALANLQMVNAGGQTTIQQAPSISSTRLINDHTENTSRERFDSARTPVNNTDDASPKNGEEQARDIEHIANEGPELQTADATGGFSEPTRDAKNDLNSTAQSTQSNTSVLPQVDLSRITNLLDLNWGDWERATVAAVIPDPEDPQVVSSYGTKQATNEAKEPLTTSYDEDACGTPSVPGFAEIEIVVESDNTSKEREDDPGVNSQANQVKRDTVMPFVAADARTSHDMLGDWDTTHTVAARMTIPLRRSEIVSITSLSTYASRRPYLDFVKGCQVQVAEYKTARLSYDVRRIPDCPFFLSVSSEKAGPHFSYAKRLCEFLIADMVRIYGNVDGDQDLLTSAGKTCNALNEWHRTHETWIASDGSVAQHSSSGATMKLMLAASSQTPGLGPDRLRQKMSKYLSPTKYKQHLRSRSLPMLPMVEEASENNASTSTLPISNPLGEVAARTSSKDSNFDTVVSTSSPSRKILVVGDASVGKTFLLSTFVNRMVPVKVDICGHELFSSTTDVANITCDLALQDTPGLESLANQRPAWYKESHVCLLCFAIDSRDSFENVREWYSEVRIWLPEIPMLLVGCKGDLRHHSIPTDPEYVSEKEAHSLADELKIFGYMECSAQARQQVDMVFDQAARLALLPARRRSFRMFRRTIRDDKMSVTCQFFHGFETR